MIRPLSKDERRLWSQGTEDIATNARGFVSAEVLAMNRQRYEATLQAKDKQIEELARAILDADYDDLQEPQRLARAAIKEATYGS